MFSRKNHQNKFNDKNVKAHELYERHNCNEFNFFKKLKYSNINFYTKIFALKYLIILIQKYCFILFNTNVI